MLNLSSNCNFVLEMKKILHKTISTLLAIVVLFSTMSFTVSKHYCGGTLVDTAIFEELKGCGIQMASEELEIHEELKKTCCINVASFIEGEDTEQVALQKMNAPTVYFAIAFIHSFRSNEVDFTVEDPFYPPSPSLVTEDITVLYENFRI